MQLSDRQSAARGHFVQKARELVGNHYDDFVKKTEPTARWQKIERLVDPAYCRYHHRDYTEEVRIVPDCEIHVLTSNKEAQENVPSPID